jgi:hypothetical protein
MQCSVPILRYIAVQRPTRRSLNQTLNQERTVYYPLNAFRVMGYSQMVMETHGKSVLRGGITQRNFIFYRWVTVAK